MKRNVYVILVGGVLLTACGAVNGLAGNGGAPTGRSCASQSHVLLSANEVGADMSVSKDTSSAQLGLWGNGDAAYPGFRGQAERLLAWSGLAQGTARQDVQQAWTDLHYSGTAPDTFLPTTGALFTHYPNQVFHVAEETQDFGSAAAAQRWMGTQRAMNQPNSDPKSRNGVEQDPAVPTIGDETFAYQISNGASGDVLTDVIVRQGSVILSVSIDHGPQLNAVDRAVGLARQLLAREHAVCP